MGPFFIVCVRPEPFPVQQASQVSRALFPFGVQAPARGLKDDVLASRSSRRPRFRQFSL